MAGDLPVPPMRLIDDGPELFHREGGLRGGRTLLIDPGAGRHVHLDPVGTVIELLARRLAGLDRTVDQLRPLRYCDLRRVALEVIAAGGGNGPRHDEHARPGNVALVDRLLDADVPVARALGLNVADRGEPLLERAPRGDDRPRYPVGGRELEQLHVVTAGRGFLSLQEDMSVA